MSAITDLIANVRRKGVTITLDDDGHLKLRGPAPEVKAAKELLTPHKNAIIARLTEDRAAAAATVTISPEVTAEVNAECPVPCFLIDRFVNALAEVESVMRKEMNDPGSKYFQNETWREISAVEHAMHALEHLRLWLRGDELEAHLGHALTRILMAQENICAGRFAQPISNSAAVTQPSRPCWRCGASAEVPSPAAWIATIRALQGGRDEYWQWTNGELTRLEQRLEPGDIVTTIFAFSVRVRRVNGTEVELFKNDA